MAGPSNHIRMQTVSGTCPDPEALAAFVDQGSSAAEHVQVEAHLAACDDCRLLVARILETQSAVQGADAAGWLPVRAGQPRRVAAFSPKRVMWGTASLVAAAAVLALAVNVGIDPSAHWRSLRAGSKLADLAAAVGDERTIEARLTGGFRYGPLRAAVRSGGSSAARDHWTLYAAAGRIREVADRDPSAPNLHALGLAHLVLGQYDEAVRALEDAVSEDPDQPRYQSDLCAAYLARARQLDRPDDLPRALGAAERAVKGDERLLEARFNRALALEALFLEDQARQAWEDYLARDSSSGWANDARAHLQKLQKQAVPPSQGSDNSPPPITDTTVEAGLDWLLRHGLPAWAEAILANDVDRAAREHLVLTDYAQQISSASGDRFPVSLMTPTIETRDAKRRAETVRAFAEGLLRFDADDMTGVEVALTPICSSPDASYAALCDFYLGVVDVLKGRDADVTRRSANLRTIAIKNQWSYPHYLSRRLSGYELLFDGNYAGASSSYNEAFRGFLDSRFLNSASNLASQLADIADIIGVPSEGWRWRQLSLQFASRSGTVNTWYLTRLQTAGALVAQREGRAAAAVIESIAPALADQLTDLRRAFLEITRARIAIANGETVTARNRLEQAQRVIARSQDFRARRLITDVLTVQSAVEQREMQFDAARTTLTTAIETMGPERGFYQVAAYLTRANLAGASGFAKQSEADVNTAVALLRGRAHSGQVLRFEEANDALEAIASLAARQSALQGIRGAHLLEQLRELLNGVPPQDTLATESELEAAIRRQPPTAISVSFLLSSDSLLAWVLSPEGIQFARRPASAASVTRAVNALTVQINRNPNREDLWRPTLAALYDMLLRDLPGIARAAELTIVPDGPLARVPFGALFDERTNSYLFERSTVRIVPALAFAFRQSGLTASGPTARISAAVIGDPLLAGPGVGSFRRLPRAKAEAIQVARLYKSAQVVIGEQATKSRVLEAIAAADVIHYAGHAVAARQGARLLLAGEVADPNTALAPEDLRGRLKRPVRVVLAACETGATSTDRASGLASLSAAFLRGGAASIVVSLWEIDDAGGEIFFSNVHRELAAGQSTPAAVARAQRACRTTEPCNRAAAIWIGTTVYGSH
jgi:CHAT domain-containing protein/tetratricopeptide (TPR) repeat protein